MRTLFIIIGIIFVSVINGCTPNNNQIISTNPGPAYFVDIPDSWETEYSSRSGQYLIHIKDELWNDKPTRIEFYGTGCRSYPPGLENTKQFIYAEIDRIKNLYHLDTITILQWPIEIYKNDYIYTHAEIEIPLDAMPSTTNNIDFTQQGEGTNQIIDLYSISNENKTLFVHVVFYKDTDEKINAQAEAIIFSFHLECDT
jgi:hypothetical protein